MRQVQRLYAILCIDAKNLFVVDPGLLMAMGPVLQKDMLLQWVNQRVLGKPHLEQRDQLIIKRVDRQDLGLELELLVLAHMLGGQLKL